MFVNETKLARAMLELKREGKTNPTHEEIKAKYLSYGGKYIEETTEETPTETPVEEIKTKPRKEKKNV